MSPSDSSTQDEERAVRQIQVDRFVRYLKANIDKGDRYAFFLGAGCSMPDIPSASDLVRQWLPRLCEQETGASTVDPDWLAGKFPDYDADDAARWYGRVMGELFLTAADRQREIERIVSSKDPGFAYAVLAKLLSHEEHGPKCNVVLTTNFDDMVADALYVYGRRKPLVVVHESLAGFVEGGRDRPIVVKLHGDALLSPKNLGNETRQLAPAVRSALEKQLTQRGIIFAGYGGNDESIASFFETYLEGKETPGLFWVNDRLPESRFGEWFQSRPDAIWVPHLRFDELMVLVREAFDLAHPDAKRFEKLMARYRDTFAELTQEVDRRPDEEHATPASASLRSAVEQARQDFDSWWAVELEAQKYQLTDSDRADKIYREGIARFSSSPDLIGNYALFLDKQGRTDEAEDYYRRALNANPGHPNNLGNYANFLDEQGRTDEAEDHYRRALDADPDRANTLGNYALFLSQQGRTDEAEDHYRRALDADPDRANTLGNYAAFLDKQGRTDEAEDHYRRALDADPNHANNLGNYTGYLFALGQAEAAVSLAMRALEQAKRPKHDQLLAEVQNYRYTNGSADERPDALKALKTLIEEGVRTPGWDFTPNVERAEADGHPEIDLVRALAAVLSDGADPATLDAFDAWTAVS